MSNEEEAATLSSTSCLLLPLQWVGDAGGTGETVAEGKQQPQQQQPQQVEPPPQEPQQQVQEATEEMEVDGQGVAAAGKPPGQQHEQRQQRQQQQPARGMRQRFGHPAPQALIGQKRK